ncbi:MAG: alpha/beta hydrolase [Myxococcaceae bacterium]
MTRIAHQSEGHPSVDDVDVRALYSKSTYQALTSDGWALAVTRYQPVPQAFPQPLLGEPVLLVHGFSQNRHTWSSGQLVKNLLYFGLDLHLLELRGHGKSSVEAQRARSRAHQTRLPEDIDFGWDIDSYFLEDVPAGVAAVKATTQRERIFYCGHSMGGMLGYGYAGQHTDLAGLVTIGAASDLGHVSPLLRTVAFGAPLIGAGVDGFLKARGVAGRVLARFTGRAASAPQPFRSLPLDVGFRMMEQWLAQAEASQLLQGVAKRTAWLSNPERVHAQDVRWLLRQGGEPEPRKVVEQFARWIRRNEMKCYRTGYDFKAGFQNISIPTAIIFGDMDPLASVDSTRSVYRAAKSQYLLWRPVKGNSHLELTMGHDIRQICYDIKNLIEYAKTHGTKTPALPS